MREQGRVRQDLLQDLQQNVFRVSPSRLVFFPAFPLQLANKHDKLILSVWTHAATVSAAPATCTQWSLLPDMLPDMLPDSDYNIRTCKGNKLFGEQGEKLLPGIKKIVLECVLMAISG